MGNGLKIMRLDHSFERGLTNVTATYTLHDDGSVGVLNCGSHRAVCQWKEAEGRAVFQGVPDMGEPICHFRLAVRGRLSRHRTRPARLRLGFGSRSIKDDLWIRPPGRPVSRHQKSPHHSVVHLVLVDLRCY